MKHDVRALLIGRFQPIHLGHIHAVRQILRVSQEVVIVVGSAQASHSLENPLTAGERVYMINKALQESKVNHSRTYIITIPDIQFNSVWPAHIRSYAPPFHVVYTGNSLVATLFAEAGYQVRRPQLYERDAYSGTRIRRLLMEGNTEWKRLVAESTANIIEKLGIRGRLLSVAENFDQIDGREVPPPRDPSRSADAEQ